MRITKKICIFYWDLGMGGIQKRIKDLVNAISQRHPTYEIHVLLRRKVVNGFDTQIKESPGTFIHYYPFSGIVRPPLGFIFWAAWKYISLAPTVVLTFQAILSSLLVTFKYIFFWINPKLVINEGAVTSKALEIDNISRLGVLVKIFYRLADTVIVPTVACKTDLITNFHVPAKKLAVIPNWTLFPPLSPLRSRFDIIYVGRFSDEKNPYETLLLAVKLREQFPSIQIAMVGDGYLRSQLQAEVQKRRLMNNVKFFKSTNDIQTHIRRAKMLFVPSHNEGMPNVVLEAAMSQIPSVISDFFGAKEVIQHGKTGFVYSTLEDAVELVSLLLNNPALRKKIGKAAQQTVIKKHGHLTQLRYIKAIVPT